MHERPRPRSEAMPDHPPVLEYRGPASGGARSVWRVLGGITCVFWALAMLSMASLGGVALVIVGTEKTIAWDAVMIASIVLGVGSLLSLVSIHGAHACFRKGRLAEEASADDSVESVEDTDV